MSKFIFCKCTKNAGSGLHIHPPLNQNLSTQRICIFNKHPETLALSDQKENAGFLGPDFRVV